MVPEARVLQRGVVLELQRAHRRLLGGAGRGVRQLRGQLRGRVDVAHRAAFRAARRGDGDRAIRERDHELGVVVGSVALDRRGFEPQPVVIGAADVAVLQADALELDHLARGGHALLEDGLARAQVHDAGERVARVGDLLREQIAVAGARLLGAQVGRGAARPALADLERLLQADAEIDRVVVIGRGELHAAD